MPDYNDCTVQIQYSYSWSLSDYSNYDSRTDTDRLTSGIHGDGTDDRSPCVGIRSAIAPDRALVLRTGWGPGVRDGFVAVNTPGAWLHNIEGEAYVVSPACFEAFAAGRDLAPATVRNRVVRLGRHRQRASPSGSANVFRAVLADGSRVKGMVFPGELVWDDDPPPRANASLVGRGR